MPIISRELVEKAIELARPSADAIIHMPGATWGPDWVEGRVEAPGVQETIRFVFGANPDMALKWREEWGEKRDFGDIALEKMIAAKRLGTNTNVIVANCPWQLKKGEYLYPGGVYRDGICVGVSGATSWADQAIAEIVASAIVMLAHLEVDRRLQEGGGRIQ